MDDKILKQIEAANLATRKAVIDDIVSKVAPPPPERQFESLSILKKKAAAAAENEIDKIENTAEKGFAVIIKALQEHEMEAEAEAIIDWFEANGEKLLNTIPKTLNENEDKSLEELWAFPQELFQNMYQGACFLVDKKPYDEVIAALAFCLLLNATQYEIWFTYGVVFQKNHQHEEAVYAFNIASILCEEENPYIYAHIARSLIPFKLWEEALEFLKKATELCHENHELKTYCAHLHQWIKQKHK